MSDLKFALANKVLVHVDDTKLTSDLNYTCLCCGESLSRNTDMRTFEHNKESTCTAGNPHALCQIAKQLVANYKYMFVPTQYIENVYFHLLEFEKVETDVMLHDGIVADAVGYIGSSRVVIFFVNATDQYIPQLDDYVLRVHISDDFNWDFSNFFGTLNLLKSIVCDEEGTGYKYWTAIPFSVASGTDFAFNTAKNGVNLDAIQVDDMVITVEDLVTLQSGRGTVDQQAWFWDKATVWKQGVLCAWQGCLYAHKCRRCSKIGESGCSLKYPVPASQPSASVAAAIEYVDDIQF